MNRTIRIGVTGSIGMGKSAVAKHFAALGFPIFDADACVHKLYSGPGPAVELVSKIFPSVLKDGGICRNELSSLIKNDNSNSILKQLESIIHPLVLEEREKFFREATKSNHLCVVYDIPLLFEGKRSVEEAKKSVGVDYVVVVSAHEAVQEQRVLQRDNMTADKFRLILGKQMRDEEKRSLADYVVYTDRHRHGDPDSCDNGAVFAGTGVVGFTAAKAQVARVVEDILSRHPDLWQSWIASRRLEAGVIAPTAGGETTAGVTNSVYSSSYSSGIDTVVFDLDDTLLDFSRTISGATGALLRHMDAHMPGTYAVLMDKLNRCSAGFQASTDPQTLEAVLNSTLKPISEKVKADTPWLVHNVCDVRREALRRLSAPYDEQHLVSAAMDVFIRERTKGIKGNLFLDALPCLRFLNANSPRGGNSTIDSTGPGGDNYSNMKGRRYNVGVMSNGYIDFPLLERHFPEFTNLLDFYMQAADAGAQKPSVVPFLAVIHHSSKCQIKTAAGVSEISRHHHAGNILYVGDSYSKDVLAARSAGMKGVWLVRPSEQGQSTEASMSLHDSYQAKPDAINEVKLRSLDPEELASYLDLLHSNGGIIPKEREV